MATTIGSFSIEMAGIVNDTHALSATPGDSMTETLRVKPEGIPWSLTNNVVLEGLGTVFNPSFHSMGLNWPDNRVAGSEEILCQKFMRFMMMRAENFFVLRRKPLKGYDISFLITNFHTEQMLKNKLVDFVIYFMEEIDKEISEMKLSVNARARIVAEEFLKRF